MVAKLADFQLSHEADKEDPASAVYWPSSAPEVLQGTASSFQSGNLIHGLRVFVNSHQLHRYLFIWGLSVGDFFRQGASSFKSLTGTHNDVHCGATTNDTRELSCQSGLSYIPGNPLNHPTFLPLSSNSKIIMCFLRN